MDTAQCHWFAFFSQGVLFIMCVPVSCLCVYMCPTCVLGSYRHPQYPGLPRSLCTPPGLRALCRVSWFSFGGPACRVHTQINAALAGRAGSLCLHHLPWGSVELGLEPRSDSPFSPSPMCIPSYNLRFIQSLQGICLSCEKCGSTAAQLGNHPRKQN